MADSAADHLADPVGGASAWNLANALTVLRLLLVPVFVFTAIWGFDEPSTSWLWISAAVFGVAAVTDFVDGEIARRRHVVTTFGKVADPIADKALTGAALIVLSVYGQLPWWVTVVIIVREVIVTGLRFWVIDHGVIAASRGGKAKTVAQIMAIVLYLVPLSGAWNGVAAVAMGVAVIITVVTGVDYVGRALRLRRASLAS